MRLLGLFVTIGLCASSAVGQRNFLRPFSDIPSELYRIQVSAPLDFSNIGDFYGFAPMLEVRATPGIYLGVQAGPAFVPDPFVRLTGGRRVWGRELGARVLGSLITGYSSQFNAYLLVTNYRGSATVDGYSVVTSNGAAAQRGSYEVVVTRTRTAAGLGWSLYTSAGFFLQITAGAGFRSTRVDAPVRLYPSYDLDDESIFVTYIREGDTKTAVALDGALRVGWAF